MHYEIFFKAMNAIYRATMRLFLRVELGLYNAAVELKGIPRGTFLAEMKKGNEILQVCSLLHLFCVPIGIILHSMIQFVSANGGEIVRRGGKAVPWRPRRESGHPRRHRPRHTHEEEEINHTSHIGSLKITFFLYIKCIIIILWRRFPPGQVSINPVAFIHPSWRHFAKLLWPHVPYNKELLALQFTSCSFKR